MQLPFGKWKSVFMEKMHSGKHAAKRNGDASEKKKGGSRKKKATVILSVVLLAAVGIGVRLRAGALSGAEVQAYTENPAERRNIQLTLTATGTVQPANQYDVTASVQGDVLSCTFEEGDSVKKGDILYEIDKTDAENSIEQAKLSLQQSQNNYNQSLESLDSLQVKSDAAGVITTLYVSAGDQVQAGAKIADIRDSSVMELTVPFNAADVASFGVGAAAVVTIDGSFETLSGTVTAIDAADTVLDGYQIVRNVTIRVSNPGGLSTSSAATATINGIACNQGANFTYLSESTVTAGVSGKISELHVREGASVSKNQTIVTLTSTSTESQVKNSQISLQQSQLSYQNTVEKLEDYTIKAPIDGTIITKNTKVGDTLDATNGQNTLAVIYDLSYLTFDISLDELDISDVSVGQKVNITCDALENTEITGRVTKVSVAGTTENGVTTYPVTVQIDDVPDGLLPGMNVDATIVVSESENALAVPIAAVQRGNTVYVKAEGEKNTEQTMVGGALLPDGWKAVEVETGLSDDNYIEIISGLQEGDVVYVPQAERAASDEMEMMPAGEMGSMPAGAAPEGGPAGAAPAGQGRGGMP